MSATPTAWTTVNDGEETTVGADPYLTRLAQRGVLDEVAEAWDIADAGGNPCPNARPVEEVLAELRAVRGD